MLAELLEQPSEEQEKDNSDPQPDKIRQQQIYDLFVMATKELYLSKVNDLK